MTKTKPQRLRVYQFGGISSFFAQKKLILGCELCAHGMLLITGKLRQPKIKPKNMRNRSNQMERPTDVAIGFNELYLTISGRRYIAPENEALEKEIPIGNHHF